MTKKSTLYNIANDDYWKKKAENLDLQRPIHFIETDESTKEEWNRVLIEILAANRQEIPFVIIDFKSTSEYRKYIRKVCAKLKLHNDVCAIFFTSGTTGKPKPIQCTNKAFINCEKYESQITGLSKNDVIASLLPLNFKRGLLQFVLACYLDSPFMFIDKSQSYEDIIQQIIKKKVTFLSANSYQWSHLCQVMDKKNIDLDIIASFSSSAISKDTFAIMKKHTKKAVVTYGATEFGATHFIHFDKSKLKTETTKVKKTLNCVGKPNSRYCKIDVVREDEKKCRPLEKGEVVVSGENVSPSLNNIFYTGDIGYKDKNGDLYLVGRKDDQLKIKGVRTNCSQFEEAYNQYNVYAFGIPADTPGWSEVVCVFETKEPLKKIKEYVDSIQPPIDVYYRPKQIFTMKKFPTTQSGKIDKQKIKKIVFLDKISPPPAREGSLLSPNGNKKLTTHKQKEKNLRKNIASEQQIEFVMKNIWQEVLNKKKISLHDNFFNIGGNSLNIIKLHQKIEKKYPGKVSLSDLFVYTSISKLTDFIKGKE